MIPKKGAVILVAIAIVLAAVAISMNLAESDEIKTKNSETIQDTGSGEIGVTILPPEIEDKLEGEEI